MSRFKRAGLGHGQAPSILGTLQATSITETKPALPAEIMVLILDYLPVADQMRFARVSRRTCEMVYDDTRWVARIRSMGCWDEVFARQHFEEAMRRRRQTMGRVPGGAPIAGQAGHQRAASTQWTTTLFDAGDEEERRKKEAAELHAGFETMALGGGGGENKAGPEASREKHPVQTRDPLQNPSAVLEVFQGVRSIRGHARQEYGRVYGALAPFYLDLVQARSHTDPALFKAFRDPERQARMLANLRSFSNSDWSEGWKDRVERLESMSGIFEGAVLREFEQGYEFWDIDGRMRRYAHVLHVLNGGGAGADLFTHKHPLFAAEHGGIVLADGSLASPIDCINEAPGEPDGGCVAMEPSRQFLEALANKVNEAGSTIERIFPQPDVVFWAFMDKVREDIIMEYATPLFDEAHDRDMGSYLKAVSGLFEQIQAFFRNLHPPKAPAEDIQEKIKDSLFRIFEPHLDLYLQDELDYFTKRVETEVGNWEKKLSEQDASVESFYMSNFNRQADKKDFLTSFKKVVMMPVTVLPFASAKATNSSSSNGVTPPVAALSHPTRPDSPSMFGRTDSPLPGKAPTDELDAKAALMASRLEGIKSLFSIEVALSMIHMAKTSLGRASVFIGLGGQTGGEAKEQCEAIFVALLRVLGSGHIKPGFDKALGHLSQYNPRDISDHGGDGKSSGVAPLVTFIELVNVGDLISQMVDVFYEQQLAGPKIADRDDFLDPASLAKKRFEQMLDESVAAGLNKGIDVLMDEVEYICATTQQPSDYNPNVVGSAAVTTTAEKRISVASLPPSSPSSFASQSGMPGSSLGAADIGPTPTARQVVDLVSSHTRMLVGSTEKTMLEVFNGEVGLRLFTGLCKHLKRQRISTLGAIKLIADMNLYFEYIQTLRNKDLLAYFRALRELSQIYLIDAKHAKEMATVIADGDRFQGIFRAEEVYEYAQRRADWYTVRKNVERAMYGLECCTM